MHPPKRRGGRPSLDPSGRPSTPVVVRLTDTDYDAVTKAAAARRESVQDLIRRTLSAALSTKH